MDAKEREEREERAMPEVFTGKVLIPGDQIDDYLAAMNVILLALWPRILLDRWPQRYCLSAEATGVTANLS